MPELPEVQTVIETLRPRLIGRTILRIATLRPDIVTPPSFDLPAHLLGRRITNLTRRGKRIVFTLDDHNRFYIHLGMSGRLTIESPDEPLKKHTHFIAELDARGKPHHASTLRFVDPRRFGGIWWLGDKSPAGDMGPEPLTMRPAQFIRQLARTTRAIKSVLLDQTVVAGIGNIYADESLFRAAIHPLTPANHLTTDEIKRLNRAIKLILRRALRHRGSTLRDYVDANGEKGAYQKQHRVYDRFDKPCRTCKSPIHRITLGGRSTHFCPTCQPATHK